ncbi:hypothetical protein Ahy_A01g001420 [Arachis hypogaea]|uniref:Uncharacterized protein n=1 Tax=Arachis hypogaea TaxID=3818 RepID=A0A445ENF4_ARAHY|nr:hypothetical protein Ahy_A01g001420 [Arachis hypogaea]
MKEFQAAILHKVQQEGKKKGHIHFTSQNTKNAKGPTKKAQTYLNPQCSALVYWVALYSWRVKKSTSQIPKIQRLLLSFSSFHYLCGSHLNTTTCHHHPSCLHPFIIFPHRKSNHFIMLPLLSKENKIYKKKLHVLNGVRSDHPQCRVIDEQTKITVQLFVSLAVIVAVVREVPLNELLQPGLQIGGGFVPEFPPGRTDIGVSERNVAVSRHIHNIPLGLNLQVTLQYTHQSWNGHGRSVTQIKDPIRSGPSLLPTRPGTLACVSHVGPPPGPIDSEKPQARDGKPVYVIVTVRDLLAGFLCRGVEAGGLVGPISFGEWDLVVEPVDGA